MVFYMSTAYATPIHGASTTAQPSTADHISTGTTARPLKTTQTIYVESIIVMTLLFVVGVGLPTWIGYGSLDAALALGLFSAFWGGPGFGAMAAGARIALRDNTKQAH